MPMLTAPSTIVSSPLLPTAAPRKLSEKIICRARNLQSIEQRLGAAFGASFIWPASLIYFSRCFESSASFYSSKRHIFWSRSPSKRRKVMKKLQNKNCPIKQHATQNYLNFAILITASHY
ncbi:uncharacterized protein LOC109950125 isoform X1 [Prunus persica]|uniref:uncharacterized protein LOC109950125 isoform X1 n=1 Tax=Prunus persica TaxID=3760 RepID=UPI0009AB83E7|nr:uncharacterized protein LOC109950125 isoform X1 [Prunus persica]